MKPGQKEEVNFTCQLPNVVNIEERRGRGLSKSKSGSRSRSFPSFPSFGSASFGYLQSQYTSMCRSKCRNQGFHPFFSPSEAVRCTNKCVLDEMKKAEHEQVLEIYRVSHNIGSTLFFCHFLGFWSTYRGTSDLFSTALEICYMIATHKNFEN